MRQPLLVRRVVGGSMLPRLRPGQVVLAYGWSRRLHPGQVVVLRQNGRELIKRIERVTEERVFVLGDNPDQSTDSRKFGWLSRATVVGVVVWPRLSK